MDKKLLDALNNLSYALEEIAEALKDSSGSNKSATTAALQSGDFSKDLQKINEGIISIRKDTQEILKQQKTILEMSRKNQRDDKVGLFEKAGGDKKSESNIKKGVGTILLIALAVLAIGLAFKLVGNIDFLSVVGLSLALLFISVAFEKIGRLMIFLSLKDALKVSLVMVALSVAITASSYILDKIRPIGFFKLITGALIIGMFVLIAEKLQPLFVAVALFKVMGMSIFKMTVAMVAIAAGIAASSWVLGLIRPVSFGQAMTGILISAMFAVISYRFERIAISVVLMRRFMISRVALVTTMVGIAAAIAASSWVLALTHPLSFGKMLTSILIAVMFAVISFNLEKIAIGVIAFTKTKVRPTDLLLVLVGIASAIAASSWVLALVIPLTISKFLTALGIALLFALMSYVMPEMAAGIVLMDRTIGSKKMLAVVPLIFVAISLAIMLSSHILSMSADMDFMKILKILAFGVSLGVVMLVMMPSVLAVGIAASSGVGAGAILLGAAMIPVIALAVMISSHILSGGKYVNYPSWKWSLGVGASLLGFSLAILELGIIAMTGIGVVALGAGALLVPMIAMVIVKTDEIIGKGKYGNYPGWKWILGVGSTMTSFGLAVLALGIIAVTGIGAVAIFAGTKLVPMIAETIVTTAEILGKGDYSKYPGWKWVLGVGSTMTGFGLAVLGLGLLAVTGIGAVALGAGALLVPMIAMVIVKTAEIIGNGKYDKYPGWEWILGVGATITGFGLAVVELGVLAITGFGIGALAILAGVAAVPLVATSILATDKIIGKGKYDKYPGLEWALSVGSLMTVFGLAVVTLGSFILGTLGLGGIALLVGAKAVKVIARSIVDAAWIFKGAEGAFHGGPSKDWAEGVSLAIGAFSPVYKMMMRGGIMGIFTGSGPNMWLYAAAIETISKGIVTAANYFAGAKVSFEGGPKKEWSEGVGKAIGAFAPVYKMMTRGGMEEFFSGTGPTVDVFVEGIKAISHGIIAAAVIFASSEVGFGDGTYPSVKWGQGVGASLAAFAPVFRAMENSGWFKSDKGAVDDMIYGIKMISYSIVSVGKIFSYSKLDWEAYPTIKWAWNVGRSIASYMKSYDAVSLYDYSDDSVPKVASNIVAVAKKFFFNAKFFNFGENFDAGTLMMSKLGEAIVHYSGTHDILSSMKRNMSAMSSLMGVDDVLNAVDSIINVAKLFFFNKKFFNFGEGFDAGASFMHDVGRSVVHYAGISKIVSSLKGISGTIGDMVGYDPALNVAQSMVRFAKTMDKGHSAMSKKYNVNFFKEMSGVVGHYMAMVDSIREKSGIKSMLKDSVFGDPITKMASGMVKLAIAYDRMASAMIKFNRAVSMIDENKISMFKKMNGVMSSSSYMKSGLGDSVKSALGQVVSTTGGLINGALDGLSSVVTPKSSEKDVRPVNKGKHGTHSQQMDKLIDLMYKVNIGVQAVDRYMREASNERMMNTSRTDQG
jgi:hypothetical protein